MPKSVYVIGHRNPDTDSVCSAIGYAHLKQATGEAAVAARAGKLNAETQFVLEYFNVPAPVLLSDLYPRVRDAMSTSFCTIKPDDTLRELGAVMKRQNIKSVPVVAENQELVGIVSVGDLAKRYFEELEMQDLRQAGVDFTALLRVLAGTLVCGADLQRKVEGQVRVAAAHTATMRKVIAPGDVVVVGDRVKAQLVCIELGIACLIVTGNAAVPPAVCAAAEEKGVIILRSPHDSYTSARLINQSIPVKIIMQSEVTVFKPGDLLSDIKDTMISTNYRSYPVLENNRIVGIIQREHLIVREREKMILVDHNERTQAVEGIEEAHIVEIIDHHRLGGLETNEPIFIRHDPVGSTATIVANMHWHRNISIPPAIAGLLLAAVVSDTLLFRSPTATAKDRETADQLARIAGLDVQQFGLAVLKAGSSVKGLSPANIIANDLKEFQLSEFRVVISQISVLDPSDILASTAELLTYMDSMCSRENYDMVLLMVTDILQEATHLLCAGQPVELMKQAFGRLPHDGVLYLEGVMSRKKQVVPPLAEAAASKNSQNW